ncbi:hypothetical protein [Thalassovita sp.]|uniref:hypothetical protein n=1 Tax=Thalassovita sp. TaxID=1979401 RepID=UPI0029DE7704|nr:hypothetical protein [Thalassovita sp.]
MSEDESIEINYISGEQEQNSDLDSVVGQYFRAWALLDISLSMYFGRLMKTDQKRARVIWACLTNFRSKLTMIEQLVSEFVEEPEKTTVSQFLAQVDTCSKLRNEFAHQSLNLSDDGLTVTFAGEQTNRKANEAFNFDQRKERPLSYLKEKKELVDRLVLEFGTRGNPPFSVTDAQLCLQDKPRFLRN